MDIQKFQQKLTEVCELGEKIETGTDKGMLWRT